MCNLPVKTFVYETCWFHKIFSQVAHGTNVIGTPSSSPQHLGDFYWRKWKQSRSYDRIQRISEMPLNFRFPQFQKMQDSPNNQWQKPNFKRINMIFRSIMLYCLNLWYNRQCGSVRLHVIKHFQPCDDGKLFIDQHHMT